MHEGAIAKGRNEKLGRAAERCGATIDVHAVQKSDDIKQEQKGEESPRDSFSRALTNFQVGGCDGHSGSIRMYSEIGGGILHHFWHFADQNVRCVVTEDGRGPSPSKNDFARDRAR